MSVLNLPYTVAMIDLQLFFFSRSLINATYPQYLIGPTTKSRDKLVPFEYKLNIMSLRVQNLLSKLLNKSAAYYPMKTFF